MNPLVSIVLTTYKRPNLLANTLESIANQTFKNVEMIVVEDGNNNDDTPQVCRRYGAKYICRQNRPRWSYSNPAIPKNIGIRKATGDILVIQCAEVRYTQPTDLENLIRGVERGKSRFATVKAVEPDGSFREWYAGPERAPKWFLDFCQASWREDVWNIGGFDEQYQGYGFDDDDFAFRLQASGVTYEWALDVVAEHQWHPIYDKDTQLSEAGRIRLAMMIEAVSKGHRPPIANGTDWGNERS